MRRRAWVVALGTAGLLGCLISLGPARAALGPEAWRQDLRFLAETIREEHREPFRNVPEEELTAAVEALYERIPELPEHEIIAGLARIVALLQDGHTRLTLPVNPEHLAVRLGHSPDPPPAVGVERFHALPVQLYQFDDGLYVRRAAGERAGLAGSRVTAIGGLPAAEALERARPLLPVENDSGARLMAPQVLAIAEILDHLGIASLGGPVPLTIEAPDGTLRTVHLPPLAPGARPVWVDAAPEPAPLWLQGTDRLYHDTWLPEARAVYLQLNEFAEEAERPAARFVRELMREMESRGARRLVIDLRHNHGGDFSYARPFVLGLLRWELISEPGRLFVLTGRETFSAAIKLVSQLEPLVQMTTVGEPMGGETNHLGDSRRFQLPASGLTLRVSQVYWRDWTTLEDRPTPSPDLPVPLTGGDYRAGRDPVLAAALAFTPPGDLGEYLVAAWRRAGVNSALQIWWKTASDPATADRDTEEAILDLGRALLEDGEGGYARAVFGLALRSHPGSAPAHLGLARAHLALGEVEAARQALEEAERLGADEAAVEALRRRLAEGPGG